MAAIVIVVWLAGNMDRGLDITDESYYLVSALWSDNASNLTRFGHYLDIMLLLAQQEIELVRIMGLLLLAVGCISLAVSGTHYSTTIHSGRHSPVRTTIVAATAVVGGTLYYGLWLTTPSYNWFVLTACLFSFAATLSLCATLHRSSSQALLTNSVPVWTRCSAITFFIVVCFFCKPTSGAALAFLVFVCLLLNLRLPKFLGVLALLITTGLLWIMAHLYIFEEGLKNYLSVVETSLHVASLRSGEHSTLGMLERSWGQLSSIPSFVLRSVPLALIFSLLMLPMHAVRELKILPSKLFSSIKCWGLVSLIGLGAFELYGQGYFRDAGFLSAGPGLCALACLAIWTALIAPESFDRKRFDFARLQFLTAAILVFLLAFAFAFGTSNPFLGQTSFAGVCYIAAIVFIVAEFSRESKSSLGLAVTSLIFCAAVLLVFSSTPSAPYRLPATLNEQTVPIKVPINGKDSLLHVDQATAEYVVRLQTSAAKSGWLLGTPIIDLTGVSPGAALVLGAQPVGAPWILGGYPGSEDAAAFLLGLEESELLTASWILTSPKGNGNISPNILRNFSLDFPEEYVEVVSLTTGRRKERQILWKPVKNLSSQNWLGVDN